MEHRPGALFCPVLPVHGRSIVAGTPLVHGVPLSNCGLWGAEPTPPPDVVSDVLAPDRTTLVELAIVRGDEAALDAAADAAMARGAVICADAVTDDDLDRLAGLVERKGLTAIGSAGLFAALVRRRQPSLAGPRAANIDHASPTTPGVLVVAGSAATAVRNQLAELNAASPDIIGLGARGPTGESLLRRVSARLRLGATAVLTWASEPPAAHAGPAETAATMAAVAARLVVDVPSTRLVLTGGQTARSVLDALGIGSLRPLQTPHYGALVARCSDGRIVAIRPGSYGDRHSLADLVAAVRGEIDLGR
jgi:4-hydroxythreonine-4-phosphate dehydrogenase